MSGKINSLLSGQYFDQSDKNHNILTSKFIKTFCIRFEPQKNYLIFEYRGNFSLKHKDEKIKGEWTISLNDVQIGIDTFIEWSSQDLSELNLLRQFLVDLVWISEKWEPIKNYRMDLLFIVLNFLKKKDHLHRNFPELKNDIVYCFNSFSISEQKYQLESAEFNFDLCFNDENQSWFDQRDIKREKIASDTIDSLLEFSPQDDRKNLIKNTLLKQSKSWFLSRYDLIEACKIDFYNCKLKCFIKPLFLCLPEIMALLSLSFASYILFNALSFNEYFDLTIMKPFHYIINVLYICFFLLFFTIFYSIESLRLFLPRLIAGIMAGYILLLSDEMWRFISSSCAVSFTNLMQSVLPLVGVYLYIVIEINSVKGIISIIKKTFLFFIRSYSYSILIGLIVSDIFGDSMMKDKLDDLWIQAAIPGLFGHIYPHVLICLAPLALFVGIILQLLWDDKKLTDKI